MDGICPDRMTHRFQDCLEMTQCGVQSLGPIRSSGLFNAAAAAAVAVMVAGESKHRKKTNLTPQKGRKLSFGWKNTGNPPEVGYCPGLRVFLSVCSPGSKVSGPRGVTSVQM